MTTLVDTIIEAPAWDDIDLAALAERAAGAVLAELGLPPVGFQFCLLGCDDARIATLNADFRGQPQPTNVLSWPAEGRATPTPGTMPDPPAPGDSAEPQELGDIAIAWGVCQAEASAQGKPFADHVTHLIAHGLLHLLGFDHITPADATLMEGVEIGALARLGIANPY